jgi:hypothetical protein
MFGSPIPADVASKEFESLKEASKIDDDLIGSFGTGRRRPDALSFPWCRPPLVDVVMAAVVNVPSTV